MTTFEKACLAVRETHLLEYDDMDTLRAIVVAVLEAVRPEAYEGGDPRLDIERNYIGAVLAEA